MGTRLAAAVVSLVALAGCGGGGDADPAVREELRRVLELYLPRLGEAYAAGDVAGLEGLAATKERAGVGKRIDDLLAQGRTLEPELRQFSIESWNVWSHSNAYVTTVEVWDLRVYSTGTRQLLSQELGQRNRVKYQLKREAEAAAGWLVLYRSIVKSPGE